MFVQAVGEGGEHVEREREFISCLPCMGAKCVDMLHAASMASWVRLLLVVNFQFSWLVEVGNFCRLIFLGLDSFLLSGLVGGTTFHFFRVFLGLGWKVQLARGWLLLPFGTWTLQSSSLGRCRVVLLLPTGYIWRFGTCSPFWMCGFSSKCRP